MKNVRWYLPILILTFIVFAIAKDRFGKPEERRSVVVPAVFPAARALEHPQAKLQSEPFHELSVLRSSMPAPKHVELARRASPYDRIYRLTLPVYRSNGTVVFVTRTRDGSRTTSSRKMTLQETRDELSRVRMQILSIENEARQYSARSEQYSRLIALLTTLKKSASGYSNILVHAKTLVQNRATANVRSKRTRG